MRHSDVSQNQHLTGHHWLVLFEAAALVMPVGCEDPAAHFELDPAEEILAPTSGRSRKRHLLKPRASRAHRLLALHLTSTELATERRRCRCGRDLDRTTPLLGASAGFDSEGRYA